MDRVQFTGCKAFSAFFAESRKWSSPWELSSGKMKRHGTSKNAAAMKTFQEQESSRPAGS